MTGRAMGGNTVGWDDGNSNGRGNVVLQLLFYIVSVGVSCCVVSKWSPPKLRRYYNLRQPAR